MTKYKHIIIPALTLLIGISIGFSTSQGFNHKKGEYKKDSKKSTMDHSMHAMMSNMNANLENKTGAEFDKAFIEEMIVHHQGAVDISQIVLQKSDRPELKKLAQDIITAQISEIKMMSTWKAEWFK